MMKEEKLRILKLVEDGKITAEEAAKLLAALDSEPAKKGRARWLKVRVYDEHREKPKVRVNVPISLLRLGAKFGGKLATSLPETAREKLKEKGIDPESLESLEKLEDLLNELAGEGPFKLVDVEEGEEKVEVYLE